MVLYGNNMQSTEACEIQRNFSLFKTLEFVFDFDQCHCVLIKTSKFRGIMLAYLTVFGGQRAIKCLWYCLIPQLDAHTLELLNALSF